MGDNLCILNYIYDFGNKRGWSSGAKISIFLNQMLSLLKLFKK